MQIRRGARLHLALGLAWTAGALACGDAESGPNGGGSSGDAGTSCTSPTLVSPTSDVVWERNTGTATLVLSFDQRVTGIESAVTSSGEGSIVGRVIESNDWRITIGDLFNGASGAITVRPERVVNACGESLTGEAFTIGFEVELAAWEHLGPIETSSVPATSQPWFVEVTEAAGFGGTGSDARAMLVDFDVDGHDDLVTVPVAALPLRPRFWRNRAGDGGFGFEEVTASSGMAEAEMTLLVFGDVDDDGDPDAVALTGHRSPDGTNGVWLNDGTGQFSFSGARGIEPSLFVRYQDGTLEFHEPAAATLADFDGDGDLDLYVGHWYSGILFPDGRLSNNLPSDDALYRNDGDGAFVRAPLPEQLNPLTASQPPEEDAERTGRAAYGLAVADHDDDGDIDIFVHNYGAGRPRAGSPPRYWDHNFLWQNDGELAFTDVAPALGVDATLRGTFYQDETTELRPVSVDGVTYPSPIGGNGFGCTFDDFDNDGDLDLISATIAHPDYPQSDRTLLFVNQGGGTSYTEESLARGLEWAEDELHPVFVDVDQDGLAELVMSRLRETKLEMYHQSTDHTFARQPYETTGVDITRPGPTLWTDLDGDGDLDFFMPKGAGRVFENRAGDGKNWLRMRLEAFAPRDATGARVTMQTSAGTQLAEVVGGGGHYNTQPSRWLHFGLGGDSGATDVTIRWPDGETQVLGAVKANQALTVVQGGEILIR